MLFLVFGSSASGKTFALKALNGRIPELAVHDFDEIGVPSGADLTWRHRANELWVRRALEHQAAGRDFLLAGQTPFGELLATPSAPLLDAISGCLIDCDDATRTARLNARGSEWLERNDAEVEDYIAWAEWLRGHANDPGCRQEVIIAAAGDESMEWGRWRNWSVSDPRWRIRTIETSDMPGDLVADQLEAWLPTSGHFSRRAYIRWSRDGRPNEGAHLP